MASETEAKQVKVAYSPREVAQLLGKSEWFVREAIKRGELPAARIGKRCLFIPKAALDAVLQPKDGGKK